MKGTTIFFDLETGGTEPKHPNTQIAAIAVEGQREVAAFERKILFDPSKCDPEALVVNHYREDDWRDACSEASAMREFEAFCVRHGDLRLVSSRTGKPYTMARIAGHNIATFDIPRVKAAMERAGVNFWHGCWWYPLDTYQLALWHFALRPGEKEPNDFKLATLAEHFGIGGYTAHDALGDVRVASEVAARIERWGPAWART